MLHEIKCFMPYYGMVIKQVGASGQVSLGKEYAGRTVVIDSPEQGVWVIRTAQVIPDNEVWIHEEGVVSRVKAGLAWAAATPAVETDLDEFEEQMNERWRAHHGQSAEK